MQRKLNVADASTREVHTRSASTILTTASAQERYLALQVAMQDVGIDADCATLRCPAQIHQVLAAEFSRPSPSPSQEGSRSVGGIFADSEDASTCTQLCSDALTSRDHTPSPSLLQPSTSSSARASPTLPPQSVHFADQDTQRLPPQKSRRIVRTVLVGIVIGFLAASSFALLYVFAIQPSSRGVLVRRQHAAWDSSTCSETLDAPWHGVFALPEHPQRAGQLMLTSEWRQATHRDPPIAAPHDVALALGRTFLFLEAQRSGALPADGRVWWRGNSTLHDGDVLGWDLEGGWFEGDSRVKSTFSIAYTTARLSWSCLFYRDALERTRFQGHTMWHWCVREVAWAASYLLKCQHERGGRLVLVVQVGSVLAERNYWGRAETLALERPVTVANASYPATEVGAEHAAALALAHQLLHGSHARLARACLHSATRVYTWSRQYRGSYASWSTEVNAPYPSTLPEQHLLFASAALFWVLKCPAAGQRGAAAPCSDAAAAEYHRNAMALWQRTDVARRCTYAAATWDSVCYDAATLLIQATGQVDSVFTYHVEALLDGWAWPSRTNRVGTTPRGLRYASKAVSGTLRNACAVSSLALMYADLPGLSPHQRRTARCLARSQLGYVLGDTGRSFVVGYGKRYPQHVQHRDSACTLEEDARDPTFCHAGRGGAWAAERPNPHVLYGALVEGPDSDENFVDGRGARKYTAVALDSNAALTSALAGLAQAPSDFWTMPCDDVLPEYPWPAGR